MKNLIDFRGKHILVIGGSSGIGRATAITLSRLGAKVGLMARGEALLSETMALLEGTGHYSARLDVADTAAIEHAMSGVAASHGAFDGFVYAAGEMLCEPIDALTPEVMKSVFDVNCFGFVEAIRQIMVDGRFREGLRIVGVSAVSALKGSDWQTAFSASKAAMDGAVRSLAIELAERNVCINTVAPGLTDTTTLQTQRENHAMNAAGNGFQYQEQKQALGIGMPQDIANVICFLLSSAARKITGACVPVDGGQTAVP